MSRYDRSLLAIFAGEQAEHLTVIRAGLENLRVAKPGQGAATIDELLRPLHTLKGAARAVGLDTTEMLTHQAEEVLTRLRKGRIEGVGTVVRALARATDAIEDVLAAALADRNPPDCADVLRHLVELADPEAAPAQEPDKSAAPAEPAATHTAVPTSPELLRVKTSSLDELIRSTSDLMIEAEGSPGLAGFSGYATRVEEIAAEWSRLRRASQNAGRTLGHSPEFRQVAACLTFMDSRLASLRLDARRVGEELALAANSAQRKTSLVYRAACRIRMTPAESVFGAFGPMVRDLAREEGRDLVFETAGLDINADLLVLQGLKDPVMHLLRNAVSHGIESPDQRALAGKPREGRIRLLLGSRGDRLEVIVEDDGRGIDTEAVLREARRQGIVGAGEVVAPEDIQRLIQRSDFSTSMKVTGVSGRGMGLAIVEAAIRRLHGAMELSSRPAAGTRVTIAAPLSISTQHVLLVTVGEHTFGIATLHVESVRQVKSSEVRNVDGRDAISTDTGPVPLYRLGSVLGLPRAAEREFLSCAILRLGTRRMAFVVDRLLDEREATIKDTGLSDAAVGATAGAIPMEDGSVAVMLNVTALFEMTAQRSRGSVVTPVRPPTASRKRRILVVDDSLTTRSLQKSILEASGFDVRLAVDGLEGFNTVRMDAPDLVISDVSMPRMTGFQLLEQMKKDPNLKKIPFILVTSLESREEQHLGLSLGADAYIVKRKFDQKELLNVIREIL